MLPKLSLLVFLFNVYCVSSILNKSLRDSCNSDVDCRNAWSFCNNSSKTCECIDGFDQTDNLCRPKGTFCPVIVKFGTERRVKPPTNSCREDDDGSNCDKNEFCFLLPRFKTTDKKRFGHCCEAPGSESEIAENTCPVSRPLENVVCPDTKGAPPEFPARIAESDTICPSYSHQCLGSSPSDKVCCPIPCRGSSKHFAVAGTGLCFAAVDEGDECVHSAQCSDKLSCKPFRETSSFRCQ